MRILVIGSGGREHALAWRLEKSQQVEHIYIAPGNGGTGSSQKSTNVPIPAEDFAKLVSFAVENEVDLVVPGPEQPLVDGIEAHFRRVGIPCFGPSPKASVMEGSKTFSKDFMKRHNIPTAQYRNFTSGQYAEAKAFVETAPFPVVLKASGLAAGKGVLIPQTKVEALAGLEAIMVRKEFGTAGDEIVIEEYLSGQELSILALSDGYTVVALPGAQDHKRIGDGDTGPNTGGMGAYSPTPVATEELTKQCLKTIIQPTIDGMRRDGMPFVGCLFTGLMLTPNGPKVLEYNVRFGDPETQTVLSLLSDDTDFAEVLLAAAEHRLDAVKLAFSPAFAATVVLASAGYPGAYAKNRAMTVRTQDLPQKTEVFHAGTALRDGKLYTAGGRVAAVTAVATTLEEAVKKAYEGVKCVDFEGMTFRKDIAYRAFSASPSGPTASGSKAQGLTYASAGVSIDAGNQLVDNIKAVVKATARPGCDSVIGGFGGLFDLKQAGFRDPVLVGGTDGVGTKLVVAHQANKHDTVGIDLVAMSVNDLIVQGAEPLFFLDYYACNHLDVDTATAVVRGVAEGCRQAGCALVGGETAEMPGLYQGDDYDLAGFAVGAVERDGILPRPDIKSGDVLLGIASSGVHSNGFSLVRKVVDRAGLTYSCPCPWAPSQSIGEALLTPTVIYVRQLLPAIKAGLVKGMSHITGGGFIENIPRMFSRGLGCEVDVSTYPLPKVFDWVRRTGEIDALEMCRTFNCGIGMIVAVAKEDARAAVDLLSRSGEARVYEVGRVTDKAGVTMKGLESWS